MRPTQRKYLPDHVVINRPNVTYLIDFDEYILASSLIDALPSTGAGYQEYSANFILQVERILSKYKIERHIDSLLED